MFLRTSTSDHRSKERSAQKDAKIAKIYDLFDKAIQLGSFVQGRSPCLLLRSMPGPTNVQTPPNLSLLAFTPECIELVAKALNDGSQLLFAFRSPMRPLGSPKSGFHYSGKRSEYGESL